MNNSVLLAPRFKSPQSDKNAFSVYGPMKFFVFYVAFTLFLHVFGPWDYKDEELTYVVIYVIFAMGLFALGYRSAVTRIVTLRRDVAFCDRNYRRFVLVAKFGLSLQVLLTLAIAASDFVAGRFSLESILNPGQIYIDALELNKDSSEVSFVGQVRTLASPLIYFSDVFLLVNYSRIGARWRFFLLFGLLFNLFHGVVTKGAQKGVFDLLILFSSVGVLKAYFDRALFAKWIRYSATFLFVAVAVFAMFQISRMSAYDALDYVGVDRMSLDRSGPLFAVLGDATGLAIALFINYLSQGYYGLSLSLQLPFEWTYGIGNSFALISYAEQYFGMAGVADMTYPFRMDAQFGWPAKMYWHTFFPWVASDLTFPGTLVLMYLIGRAYAKSFVEGVVFESPLAISVFYFLTTLLIFLPANNQLMQTREMMLSSCLLMALWLALGGRYRRKL